MKESFRSFPFSPPRRSFSRPVRRTYRLPFRRVSGQEPLPQAVTKYFAASKDRHYTPLTALYRFRPLFSGSFQVRRFFRKRYPRPRAAPQVYRHLFSACLHVLTAGAVCGFPHTAPRISPRRTARQAFLLSIRDTNIQATNPSPRHLFWETQSRPPLLPHCAKLR